MRLSSLLSPRPRSGRVLPDLAGPVLAGTLTLLALGGCSTSTELTSQRADVDSQTHHVEHHHAKQKRSEAPSLPPGDPGPSAPSVPDPGRPTHDKERPAKRQVPFAAMLDAPTVGSMIGGQWQPVDAAADPCFTTSSALGRRTVGFASSTGSLAETVTTYPSRRVAGKAYSEVVTGLRACGWTPGDDPRLGSASVRSTRGQELATFVVSEGVTVLVSGTGPTTSKLGRWAFLVDLALGTSCPAAPDGCH